MHYYLGLVGKNLQKSNFLRNWPSKFFFVSIVSPSKTILNALSLQKIFFEVSVFFFSYAQCSKILTWHLVLPQKVLVTQGCHHVLLVLSSLIFCTGCSLPPRKRRVCYGMWHLCTCGWEILKWP